MIKSIYSKYFQKSKSFLYPALGIKRKSKFSPINTYISVKGVYEPEDLKFTCTFEKNKSEAFIEFESEMLVNNPLFHQKIELDEFNVYIFDYTIYMNDWFTFIIGRYSDLSPVLKRAIKVYYGENSAEYEHMKTYLYPKEYFDVYSELLEVDVNVLKKIGELCNPCDMRKETLEFSEEVLENLKKSV
jgi:hypothetical protein